MLLKVKDKNIVKEDLLPDKREVLEFYIDNGIPEEKAEFISECYGVKVELLHEFQNGKKISLYNEKKKSNR